MNFIKKFFEIIFTYLLGVIKEAKKVRWPTPQQWFVYSVTAISFSLFVGIYLAIDDFVISQILKSIDILK